MFFDMRGQCSSFSYLQHMHYVDSESHPRYITYICSSFKHSSQAVVDYKIVIEE